MSEECDCDFSLLEENEIDSDSSTPRVQKGTYKFAIIICMVSAICLGLCWLGVPHEIGWSALKIGSLLSIFCSLVVLLMTMRSPLWRQHPAPILLGKVIVDLIFCSRMFFADFIPDLDNNPHGLSCKALAFLTQFGAFASEGFVLMSAIDLLVSLYRPFAYYKKSMLIYRIITLGGAAMSAIMMLVEPGVQGVTESGLCWIQFSGCDEINTNNWKYLYGWVIVFYLFALVALVIAVRRLKNGFTESCELRKLVIRNNCITVISFFIYNVLIVSFFGYQYYSNTYWDEQKEEYMESFYFVISCRGIVDACVWFSVVDFSLLGKSKGELGIDGNVADVDLSPQLSQEIRREVLRLVTQGVLGAANFAQNNNTSRQHEENNFYGLTRNSPRTPKPNQDSLFSSAFAAHSPILKTNTPSGNVHNSPSVNISSTSGGAKNRHFTKNGKSFGLPRMINLEGGRGTRGLKMKPSSSITDGGIRRNYSSDSLCTIPTNVQIALSVTELVDRRVFPLKSSEHNPKCIKKKNYSPKMASFTDYFPEDFKAIREGCKVDTMAYTRSLHSHTKERFSEGASSSFMYFSEDNHYIVKTCTHQESRFLRSILPKYRDYIVHNPQSYIVKFFGCHRLKFHGQRFFFVIMNNIFNSTQTINERYDIKGSWIDRNAARPTYDQVVTCRHCNQKFRYGRKSQAKCPARLNYHEPNIVLKDNDLRDRIRLDSKTSTSVREQLFKDSQFLQAVGIMDYSLLIGICNVEYTIPRSPFDFESVSETMPVQNGSQPVSQLGGNNNNLTTTSSVHSYSNRSFAIPSHHHPSNNGSSTTRQSTYDSIFGDTASLGSDSDSFFPTQIGRSSSPLSHQFNSNISSSGTKEGTQAHSQLTTSRPTSPFTALDQDTEPECEQASVGGFSSIGDSLRTGIIPTANSPLQARVIVGPGKYHLGIVDILQQYSIQKKMERWTKVFTRCLDADGVSSVPPQTYAKRFQRRIDEIFNVSDSLV
eukprot:TRINITY_DN6_c0_g8_i1.p1 TRINITY_DN6_c0_g8~~TRINITY_DN6_c0_g8_i1.p1  ORF type:complete len:989 (+),score=205.96 TRINITY_DN6_c0_g8_i1:86-3052(+)